MSLAMLTSSVGLRASFSTSSSSRFQALGKSLRLWSKDLLVTKARATVEIVNTCVCVSNHFLCFSLRLCCDGSEVSHLSQTRHHQT